MASLQSSLVKLVSSGLLEQSQKFFPDRLCKIWVVKLYEIGRGRVTTTTFWVEKNRQVLQWEYNFGEKILEQG